MFSLPFGGAAAADKAKLDSLYERLLEAEEREAHRIASEIELELSKSGSASFDLLLKRGKDAFEAGNLKEAVEHLTALTDHAPDFSEGWYYRGLTYYRLEKYGPALADLERALTITPRHYDAIGVLGIMLEEMNRPDMAYEAYQRVLEIHPYHPDVTVMIEQIDASVRGRDL